MRTVIAVLLIGLSSPALAETCWFEDPGGDRLTFLDNGENELVIQRAGGTETCSYGHADTTGLPTIWCGETGIQGVYERTGAEERDLLFDGRVWTLAGRCAA